MQNLLVLSAIGEDHTGIVEQITSLAKRCGGNIVDHRMAVLGGQCATIMMVKGDWTSLTQMEQEVPALANKLNLTTIAQKTTIPDEAPRLLPYQVKVTTLDEPGTAHKVAEFFSSRNINIEELYAHKFAAPSTGAELVQIRMQISLTPDVKIHALKEDFNSFCADYNLDATLNAVHF